MRLLETRLDAVVLRSGLAPTIHAARQVVSHGHVQVNGRRVNIPSYRLKVGDVVSVKPKSRNLDIFAEAMQGGAPPSYLEVRPAEKTEVRLSFLGEPGPRRGAFRYDGGRC